MSVMLRPMRWWDLPALDRLEGQLFTNPWSPEVFWSELAGVPSSKWCVVAVQNGVIVGYAVLRTMPPEADVQTVAVDPAAQGEGLGAQLLDALLVEATRRECSQVFLEVRADNLPAQRLYVSRGFEQLSIRHNYYGPNQDALVMRRRIPVQVST